MNIGQARALLELTLAEYSGLRNDFWARIYDAVYDYLSGKGNVGTVKRAMKKAIAETYNNVADLAWQDGGGELPIGPEANAYTASRQAEEFAFVDTLGNGLKEIKNDEESDINDAIQQAFQRADGYSRSLDKFYSNVKALAAGNKMVMLTFTGEDGEESCSDCQKYKGQRHKASWWVRRDAVPPSRSFECGGYKCQHILVDDDGKLFSI